MALEQVSPSRPTQAEAQYSVREEPPEGALGVGMVKVAVTLVYPVPTRTAPAQFELYCTFELSVILITSVVSGAKGGLDLRLRARLASRRFSVRGAAKAVEAKRTELKKAAATFMMASGCRMQDQIDVGSEECDKLSDWVTLLD